jgi:hypothetical protein
MGCVKGLATLLKEVAESQHKEQTEIEEQRRNQNKDEQADRLTFASA